HLAHPRGEIIAPEEWNVWTLPQDLSGDVDRAGATDPDAQHAHASLLRLLDQLPDRRHERLGEVRLVLVGARLHLDFFEDGEAIVEQRELHLRAADVDAEAPRLAHSPPRSARGQCARRARPREYFQILSS